MSFSNNRMSSFTEFATKPDRCECSLDNRVTDSDQGNNYVSGLDDKIMNAVYSYRVQTSDPPIVICGSTLTFCGSL